MLRQSSHRVFARLFALTIVVNTPLVAQTLVDPVVTTGDAGVRGSEVRWLDSGSPGNGIAGIAWAEKRDKPCFMMIKVKSLANGSESNGESLNLCGPDFNVPSFSDMVSRRGTGNRGVIFSGDPRRFLRHVAVCDGRSERIKGVRIAPATVPNANAATHAVSPLSHAESAEQPDCFAWYSNAATCPGDQIAAAVVVFHTREEIRGLALRCKRVVW